MEGWSTEELEKEREMILSKLKRENLKEELKKEVKQLILLLDSDLGRESRKSKVEDFECKIFTEDSPKSPDVSDIEYDESGRNDAEKIGQKLVVSRRKGIEIAVKASEKRKIKIESLKIGKMDIDFRKIRGRR